jgi:hypothetical protein
MFRRLFTLLSALSLVLCLAAVGMGVRSSGTHDQVWHLTWGAPEPDGYHRRAIRGVRSSRGVLTVYLNVDRVSTALVADRQSFFFGEGLDGFHWHADPYGVAGDPRFARFVLYNREMYAERPPREWRSSWGTVVTVTGLLPSAWLLDRFRRARRDERGQCRSCGYDLRATPGRCPECGTVPGATRRNLPAAAALTRRLPLGRQGDKGTR